MAQATGQATVPMSSPWSRASAYLDWVKSTELPVYTGYFVDDIRTIELKPWDERGLNAAILQMAGQEGVSEVRVSEIPAAKSSTPFRWGLDEIVYVADGRGLTSVWLENQPQRTFEWQKHSLFLLPRNHYYQFSNTSGDRPARLLHFNSFPMASQLIPEPEYFFGTRSLDSSYLYDESKGAFYSEAKVIKDPNSFSGGSYWLGNFFPDMRAWDQLIPFKGRGAGGHVVWIRYPSSTIFNHMSVFPSKTYKKGHRHGPGTLIVIPEGEGYSYMWPEGGEKVYIPWHEASVFVPPNRWFHQHFNVSDHQDRYLAFHAPRGMGGNERVEDRARDQIEYPAEDPIIRETFERELGKRGLSSIMPQEAYERYDFEWDYQED